MVFFSLAIVLVAAWRDGAGKVLEERAPELKMTVRNKRMPTSADGRGIYVKMKNQIKSKMKSKIK